jgi:predicted transcriptional regulator
VSVPGLGPLESAVMDVVWNAGEAVSGRTCRERLDYQTRHGEEPSYTTVMTILANLQKKRLLARVALCDRGGHPGAPAWKYEARISREEHLAAVIRAALACAPDKAAVLEVALAGLPLNPERVILLHYDRDYEHIAAVTSQPMQWVVPRGSVP